MSLRRRIAGAAALAVAVAAVAVAVIGYVTTRSHLIGQVQASSARGRRRPSVRITAWPAGGGPGAGQGQPDEGAGFQAPGPPPLGGAQGYFQVVGPDGTVSHGGALPVTSRC